jgi:AcrR family transcriptional regulator
MILEAAEKRLMQGGPEAVRIQPLARDLGLTDAAIHHHFGTRKALMTELLKFGGVQLRTALRAATGPSVEDAFDLPEFMATASQVFADRGYSRLALWLSASGLRERGSGVFDELAIGIQALQERTDPETASRPSEKSRFLAALIALVLMAEPIFGDAARRSVSLPRDAAATRRFHSWLEQTFAALIEARPD